MFKCQECGRKFKTVKSAERAASRGCPGCGGVDLDIDVGVRLLRRPPDADEYARVMKLTPGQMMRAEWEDYERRKHDM